MPQFVKKLDLPAVPAELIPDFALISNDLTPVWSNRPRTATRGADVVEHSHYDRFEISADLKRWVDTNITSDYKNIGISHMWGAEVNLPHTDHTRDITLLYLFESGGPNVQTKFWQRQGHPVYHENSDKNYHYNTQQPTTYDDLDLLASFVLERHQWYILDAMCIHSVEGMTESRISLQLGFFKQSPWAQHVFGEKTPG